MEAVFDGEGCSAWNPGVRPGIPPEFRALETIFRPECIQGDYREVLELARMTGLPHEELTAFRPARLALHELIVRVTADIAVPEGEEEEVFGHNFRRVAARIWAAYLLPRLDAIEAAHAVLTEEVAERVRAILAETLFHQPEPLPRQTFPFNLLPGRRRPAAALESRAEREQRIAAGYKAAGLAAAEPLERAIHRGLYRVFSRFMASAGYVVADADLLVKLVVRQVCNRYGSRMIGAIITPLIEAAIDQEGYARVPIQPVPILFSLKGASAAGKSSLRPMLKQLMREQGIAPESYATISPDVWRRILLDYEALGAARKYAGYLTSREVALIDGKLDRYIQVKAGRDGGIPHLMVDRFRFDSFSGEQVERLLDATYARYVDTMYMYFVVTPPEQTVERGWLRALERGRYKAVEDFLGHSVEAYTGMPKILFKWLAHRRPAYRYFFLDNRVPKGTFPRTFAFGEQDRMCIYDPLPFVNIERYQKIDTYATSVAAVYPSAAVLAVENNLGFLEECIRRIPLLEFVDPQDARPYLRFTGGRGTVVDEAGLARAMQEPESAMLMHCLLPALNGF
jgi:hypothetical protein